MTEREREKTEKRKRETEKSIEKVTLIRHRDTYIQIERAWYYIDRDIENERENR